MKNAGNIDKDALNGAILENTPQDIVERYSLLPQNAASMDFGELDRNVVVVDTESTGFSFSHDELIQIAAARLECGEIVDWYVTYVNPGKPIPEDIIHLTGICDDDVADAPKPQEALEGLVKFAGDAKMVAHNIHFDKTFVTKHPGGYPLLESTWIDTLDLSRIAIPRMKSHRLIDLVHAFGAPTSTHRADDDVAATCSVYRILLAAVYAMPPELVVEIATMAPREEWSTGYVFEQIAALQAQRAGNTKPVAKFSLLNMRRNRIGQLTASDARSDAPEPDEANPLDMEFPTTDEIAAAFDEGGLLDTVYSDYEPREEQREMSLAINDAFRKSDNLVVEAGTGVGKSMAYLVPAIMLAKKNHVSVGVATKTNSLLDQLVYQELPALSMAFKEQGIYDEVTYAPLKGISHYPCLRKVDRLVQDGPSMREVAGEKMSQAPALAALLSYIEQTDFDDLDSLKIDYRTLPRYLFTTTSNDCLKRKCPYYHGLCFAHGARKRAESVDVLVTNHSLLFCNLEANGVLLPKARFWVVDEAHGAEEEARRVFTTEISVADTLRLIEKVGPTGGSRNVFTRAERHVATIENESVTLFFALNGKARTECEAFCEAATAFCDHVKDLLDLNNDRSSRGYDHTDLWINDVVRASEQFKELSALAATMIEKADRAVPAMQELVAYLEGIEGAGMVQQEIASSAIDIRSLRDAADIIFVKAPDTYVYQATLNRKKDNRNDTIEAQMLDVGQTLNEVFYDQTNSVVYTSATLTVDGKFDAFDRAVGLNQEGMSTASELELGSSFDFDNNMIIYVVRDMPEPSSPSYLKALERLLVRLHIAQQGSMLTLFTNRREMEQCFDYVRPALKDENLRLVCQKWGVSVKGLRDDFIADEHLSLFALKSFWQGFDAPGSTLKGVIVPKLPFSRPNDPLSCERSARDSDAWRKYVLPKAIIETKQAAGRLIRKADDTGVLIFADKRLVTKSYGKAFLNSLQSKTVRICTADEVVESLSMINGTRLG